jgi:hypothetical protein
MIIACYKLAIESPIQYSMNSSIVFTHCRRRVLPPLAFWANQGVLRDARGNTIGFLKGSPDMLPKYSNKEEFGKSC